MRNNNELDERRGKQKIGIVYLLIVSILLSFLWSKFIFNPFYASNSAQVLWRVGFCILMGLSGLSLRAIYMSFRDFREDPPAKKYEDYLIARPIIIVIGSCFVFSFLSFYGFSYHGWLFYTLAFPFSFLMGFFSHELFLALPFGLMNVVESWLKKVSS
jgi:hypothetical protein